MLAGLDSLAEVCDAGTRVIVIGRHNDVTLYRELVRRGVSDYLIAPVGTLDIVRAVCGLFSAPDAKPVGRILAVIGAKGGVGASTVAHNIAWAIARDLALDSVVTDLDLAFGTAGLDYNQDPPQGIADAVFSPERIDTTFVDRLLSKCSDNLSLLAAPATLDRVYDFGAEAFDSIFDSLRATVPCIVLDVPHQWTGWTQAHAAQRRRHPDRGGARSRQSAQRQEPHRLSCKAARANDHRPFYLLNQVGVPKRPEIKPADFAKALDDEPVAIIPFDPQLFGTAANNGQMIAEVVRQAQDRGDLPPARAAADRPRRSRRKPESGLFAPLLQKLRKQSSKLTGVVSPCSESVRVNSIPSRASGVAVAPRAAAAAPAPAPAAPLRRTPHPTKRPRADAVRRARRAAAAAADWRPQKRPAPAPMHRDRYRRSETYYEIKGTIFSALIEAIDLAQLARLDADAAREEIRDIVNEIIAIKNIVMSISEQEELLDDICNDVLGYGPLEPLLARDDIADIMVNGSGTVYIEVAGKIQKTGIRFRDNQQLLNICQRIVSQIGRRVDESSPICDARLPDGSRVNAIVPPLAIDGPALTIRKFKKDKLTLDQLVKFGSISPEGAEILQIIGRCRVNTIVSGGTGSGKTTLLNCLTRYIDDDERIITCEDAAELQLQQPHVVRLETRPPNLEGEGQVTMRDLVKNCLRMRPGTDHRRRSARTRGVRPAAGDEYRP